MGGMSLKTQNIICRRNLGHLGLYFPIIGPVRDLNHITRTHSKPNPNKITPDDTHPIRQKSIFPSSKNGRLSSLDCIRFTLTKVVDWILVWLNFRVDSIIFTLRPARLNGVNSAVSWPAQCMDSAI